jgi:hypothetical protein
MRVLWVRSPARARDQNDHQPGPDDASCLGAWTSDTGQVEFGRRMDADKRS